MIVEWGYKMQGKSNILVMKCSHVNLSAAVGFMCWLLGLC